MLGCFKDYLHLRQRWRKGPVPEGQVVPTGWEQRDVAVCATNCTSSAISPERKIGEETPGLLNGMEGLSRLGEETPGLLASTPGVERRSSRLRNKLNCTKDGQTDLLAYHRKRSQASCSVLRRPAATTARKSGAVAVAAKRKATLAEVNTTAHGEWSVETERAELEGVMENVAEEAVAEARELNFKVGDLVWVSGFGPMWPAEVAAIACDSGDTAPYGVRFFGEKTSAWVSTGKIRAWSTRSPKGSVLPRWRRRMALALADVEQRQASLECAIAEVGTS